MNQYDPDYVADVARPAGRVIPAERAAFIRRTYAHLAVAILAFAAIDAALLQVFTFGDVARAFATMPMGWLGVLAAYMVVSWIAERWARADMPMGMQYLGLGLYVVLEAIIFLPLLCLAQFKAPGAIESAGIMTLCVFGGLTTATLMTGKDFSFLRTAVVVGSWVALGLIVAACLIGLQLGMWFALAMVGLLCACILYQTSNVMYYYRTDQHVGAALALFASFATLLWYVLQLYIRARD